MSEDIHELTLLSQWR